MTDSVWTFTYSVESNTGRDFSWRYWTDIANWNDPPAQFVLDGPFDVGSKLTTTAPAGTYHSLIRHVETGAAATIEMQLQDGVLSFHWKFEDVTASRSRITQRLILSATDPASIAQARLLEQTVPAGMAKLVADMERAQQGEMDTGEGENPSVSPLVLQLLEWVSRAHRSYTETMDAWRSTCPRLTIWEDALIAGLVQVETDAEGTHDLRVSLTTQGVSVLERKRGKFFISTDSPRQLP